MKKCLLLLNMAVMMFALTGAEDFSGMRGFALGHVKLPIYDKEQLQLVVFADSGTRQGALTVGKNTTIDMLLKNVNVDKIADGWDEKLYPLNAKLPQILRFWRRRQFTSSAVLFTPQCNINMTKRTASSDERVYMRAPTFDLNGIGFTSDFNTKVTEINSDIRIVARTESSDPRLILGGAPMPPKYETVVATSDSMRIDMKHNEIMLIGHVRAVDNTAILECDRLTIFLDDNASMSEKTKKAAKAENSSILRGVSRILADGDVVLTQRNEDKKSSEPPIQGFCEHLEYEISSGLIVMSGDTERPKIIQGKELRLSGNRIEMLRFSKTAFVSGKCDILTTSGTPGKPDFSSRRILSDKANYDDNNHMSDFHGNVSVVEKDMTMTCDHMRVFFTAPRQDSKTSKNSKGTEFSPVSGRREIDRILCSGNLKIVSLEKDAVKKTEKKSTISSEKGEFDYTGNRLVFLKNVDVRDGQGSMKCQRLDLFLKDKRPGTAKTARTAPGAAGTPGRGKILQKSISTGKVYMKNEDSDLSTDLLTMEFRELPAGSKPQPGMFASGNVQLVKIICDGQVVAREFQKTAPAAKSDPKIVRVLKAQHAFSDLLKDFSEFHGKVSVDDFANLLNCQDMYVYTVRQPGETAVSAPAKADDPDADPFALDQGENSAPSRIALSEGLDLKKIICKNHVKLTRKDDKGKPVYAGGDTAVYDINSRNIVITANRPARPYLLSSGRKQYSDEIRADLATEIIEGIGNINVVPAQ